MFTRVLAGLAAALVLAGCASSHGAEAGGQVTLTLGDQANGLQTLMKAVISLLRLRTTTTGTFPARHAR